MTRSVDEDAAGRFVAKKMGDDAVIESMKESPPAPIPNGNRLTATPSVIMTSAEARNVMLHLLPGQSLTVTALDEIGRMEVGMLRDQWPEVIARMKESQLRMPRLAEELRMLMEGSR